MFRVSKTLEHSSLSWLLFSFSLLYLAVAFPFSYFRNDDWLMIGNVARIVPSHWKFLFEPYLIYNSNPEIWFFRPWFKLLLYVLYKTLGFQYYGWLAVNLIFTLATLVLGHLTIVELTGNVKKGLLFIAFFISSIHFHFASLVWVGEGTMNCPQLFLLFLNFYCFSKVINSKKRIQVLGFYLLGCLAFILSLGFKEAAIFHLPFLLILLFNNSTSQKRSLKFKISLLIPFGLITICYLYFRLFLIPFNPGYKPQVNIEFILPGHHYHIFRIVYFYPNSCSLFRSFVMFLSHMFPQFVSALIHFPRKSSYELTITLNVQAWSYTSYLSYY